MHTESRENKIVSILERESIEAPQGFVSVFHETTEDRLSQIDAEGLRISSASNIGGSEMNKRNALVDEFRPKELKDMGVSRSNIFAYPYLEYGHGLLGADQRYVKKDRDDLEREFELHKKYSPEYLEKLKTKDLDSYIAKVTNLEYLRSQYSGEILEMKVDPKNCYVGDMEFITRIFDDIKRGWSEKESAENQANYYWRGIVTLENFIRWYAVPKWAENGNDIQDVQMFKEEPYIAGGFHLLRGAPGNLPAKFDNPEILIPQDVPQELIRVLK